MATGRGATSGPRVGSGVGASVASAVGSGVAAGDLLGSADALGSTVGVATGLAVATAAGRGVSRSIDTVLGASAPNGRITILSPVHTAAWLASGATDTENAVLLSTEAMTVPPPLLTAQGFAGSAHSAEPLVIW